jgi:pilus assembly protein Flp/PilA
MLAFIGDFLRDEAGATAIEYGLIAAMCSIVIIGAAAAIGGGVQSKFEMVQNAVG